MKVTLVLFCRHHSPCLIQVVLQAQPRKYGEDYLVRGGALHAQGDLPSLRQQSFGFRHARSLPTRAAARQLWTLRTSLVLLAAVRTRGEGE